MKTLSSLAHRLASFRPAAVAVGCLTILASGLADIIPANRRVTWQPGVPGGIPARTTVFADVTQSPYFADKSGAADASAKIQLAINACPVGQVVYIPAGTYRLNSQLTITKGIVIRGDGPGRTKLESYANWHAIQMGDWPSSPVAANVTGSPAKGTTTLTVSSITSPAIAVGTYIVIDQINDGVEVINVDDQSRDNNTRCLSQITKVTSVSGSGPYTLGISPGLYHAYAAAQTPQVWKLNQGIAMTEYAGLENLSVDRIAPIAQNGYSNIKMVACAYCWVKNVESTFAIFRHVDLDRSFRCEIRDSLFDNGYYHEVGGYAYGVVCANRSTDILTENNTFHHLRHSMVVKEGATGCVYGYNYSFDTYQGDGWLAPDMFVHGAHANMNLFEGNYATKIDGDFTHGSGSYNTFFRNFVTRTSNAVTVTGGRWPVNNDVTQSYSNFVGNVLGSPGLAWTADETSATRNTSSTYEWSWGFQGDGDTSRDSTVPHDTALRHGNFEPITQSIVWDATIADHSLPSSLYLTAAPGFFGSVVWPALGADLSPAGGVLPAKARYEAGFETPGQPPTNARVSIQSD
ncbi:MAG TPA: glycosyl hydrolase family 28-related protein [Candidatus Didemnitutus sp.]|nr:glycosyl hydrolase family 28-related protein [Candidatus Didemnitutus sp.]